MSVCLSATSLLIDRIRPTSIPNWHTKIPLTPTQCDSLNLRVKTRPNRVNRPIRVYTCVRSFHALIYIYMVLLYKCLLFVFLLYMLLLHMVLHHVVQLIWYRFIWPWYMWSCFTWSCFIWSYGHLVIWSCFIWSWFVWYCFESSNFDVNAWMNKWMNECCSGNTFGFKETLQK